ncbi:uncharacterized protein [Clytia hemisphaerica]|uniref:Uncharacterized protein n=1 Tax=Clytia hemisphaerica TaxID=252671 RepID=A0A7M5VAK2_9CNID
MHVLKSVVSSLLLITSICWIGIQHLFLTPESFTTFLISRHQKKLTSSRTNHHKAAETFDFLQLRRDWCRVKSKQIAWREILGECMKRDYFKKDKRFATNPQLSQVSQVLIKSAGEHTSLRIDTFNNYGMSKTFGGDSIRVIFHGPETISASVFDLQNGSYDAIALLRTPGFYRVQVLLEYTLCNGIKEPQTEWYVNAHCASSKNNNTRKLIQADTQSKMNDYIHEEISPGILIEIPKPNIDLTMLPEILTKINCGFKCKSVWDGHGSWRKNEGAVGVGDGGDGWQWKETIPTIPKMKAKNRTIGNRNHSTLWIYGDSISYYFYKRLKKTSLCTDVFQSCNNTYNWIYPKKLYEMRHFCNDIDVDPNRIVSYFNQVVQQPQMDEHSVLIFNLGAHFVKNTSFRKYRKIINRLLETLKTFQGHVIWKSTTAIHNQDIRVMGAFRRYLTSQRVELFNAYANSMICTQGHHLLDIYPLTASFPSGTKDGVHYHRNAQKPMEEMLTEYFSM